MSIGSEQRIFISYRRSDCQSQANGLHDGLRHRMTESRIFMDIDSIPPGADFEEHIRNEIEQCQVVLVLIGDEWLDRRPGTDARRIDEANDFVRLEVESSLASDHVRVIPVLVEGASMPQPEELPESIRRLARLNAFELSDSRWTSDVERLSQQLRQVAAPSTNAVAAPPAPSMSFADVDEDAIRYALSVLPSSFKTKDLSEHPAVLATHTEVCQLRNYHTIMGRFLMQHRHSLGLGEPARPADERGSIWTKSSATQPAPRTAPEGSIPVRATTAPRSPHFASAPVGHQGTSRGGWLMVALPILTFGLAAWVPSIRAATRPGADEIFRKQMWLVTAAIVAALVVGFVLVGSAPEDKAGTATGPAANIGAVLFLLAMGAGVVVAMRNRRPQ